MHSVRKWRRTRDRLVARALNVMREFVHSKQLPHPFPPSFTPAHNQNELQNIATLRCQGTFKELKIASGTKRRRSVQTQTKFLALDNLEIPADCLFVTPPLHYFPASSLLPVCFVFVFWGRRHDKCASDA